MESSSNTGASTSNAVSSDLTHPSSFILHPSARDAYILLQCWEQTFSQQRGFPFRVFPHVLADQVFDQPGFHKFEEAAAWLAQHHYKVGTACNWQGYVRFVCQHIWDKQQMPSPRHLRSEMLFRKYVSRESQAQPEPAATRSDRDLFNLYQRLLGPRLRTADCMTVLGLQQLAHVGPDKRHSP